MGITWSLPRRLPLAISKVDAIIILSKERGVAILDYDASCGSDVVIPETIEGYPVRIIGNEATEIDSSQFWRLENPNPRCWQIWCLVKDHFLE